jgi:RNA polymerase sigma factor (sigma-70 family)
VAGRQQPGEVALAVQIPPAPRNPIGRGRKGAQIMTAVAGWERDDPPVTDLVMRARNSDKQAWDDLVERYAPLIWSICRRYRLDGADADDVGQTVWLHLVDQLDRLRDPAALAGWLATTTQRECLRVLRAAQRPQPRRHGPDIEDIPDRHAVIAEQELLTAERHAALREALTRLPPRCQQLLALLLHDPPLPYAQISARLGIPVGSIGPSRARCLDTLRRHQAIAALMDTEPANMTDKPPSQAMTP